MGKLFTTVDVAIQSRTWSNPTCRRNEVINIINSFLHAAWDRMSTADKATWENSPLYTTNAKLAFLKTNMGTMLTTASNIADTWSLKITSVYPGFDTTPKSNLVGIDYTVNESDIDLRVTIPDITIVWCAIIAVERDRLGGQGYQDVVKIVPGWELSDGAYAIETTIGRPSVLTDVLVAAVDTHGNIFGYA